MEFALVLCLCISYKLFCSYRHVSRFEKKKTSEMLKYMNHLAFYYLGTLGLM
jgi:hypothetical protein